MAKKLLALSIDVEEFYHAEAMRSRFPIESWPLLNNRVHINVSKLLYLLEKYKQKATFFVLGVVAEKNPGLIIEILNAGHEIASHGWNHEMVYLQSEDLFIEQTRKSKLLLEDITQRRVIGYRAATYSITKKSLWALDGLASLGFEYDSSIFPIRHDRYGIPTSPLVPYFYESQCGERILEFPISTIKVFNYNLPCGGGGYFRLFPEMVFRIAIERCLNAEKPYVFYIHPWEIDLEQPKVNLGSVVRNYRHYHNIDKCYQRLEKLLSKYKFSTMNNVIESIKRRSKNAICITRDELLLGMGE